MRIFEQALTTDCVLLDGYVVIRQTPHWGGESVEISIPVALIDMFLKDVEVVAMGQG